MNVLYRLLTIVLFISFTSKVYADWKEVGNGAEVDELMRGYIKIIPTNEDGTFVIYQKIKDEIKAEHYDVNHKLILAKKINIAYQELAKGEVIGVINQAEHIAVFISTNDKAIPILTLLLIDKKDLSLKKEEVIVEIPKTKLNAIFADKKDLDLRFPFFEMVKDEHSDNYAILTVNTRTQIMDDKYALYHFNERHEQISKSDLKDPSGGGKITSLSYVVEADKKVDVLMMNNKNGFYFGSMVSDRQQIDFEKLTVTGMSGATEVLMRYNAASKEYLILAVKEPKPNVKANAITYLCHLPIGASSLIAMPVQSIKRATSSVNKNNKLSKSLGLAQDLIIKPDGSFSIVYEDAGYREVQYVFADGPNSTESHTKYFLRDVSVANYDKEGAEINSFSVPKSHQIATFKAPFEDARNAYRAALIAFGFHYKTYKYINTANGSFLFFNDYEENQQKIDKQSKIKTVLGLGECLAYSFKYSEQNENISRTELWQPSTKKDRKIALFAAAEYNTKNDLLVLFKVDHRAKKMQLVWLEHN